MHSKTISGGKNNMWKDNDIIMDIFRKANEGGTRFPCQCPVCRNPSAHIYIHRHDSKHCGIWTWCTACGASAHLSGEAPGWWRNPDFVDADQLHSDPSYFNEISDKIDQWVNSLLPAQNVEAAKEDTMEDRFHVVFQEELQGIPAGAEGTIVIRNDFRALEINFIGTDGKTVRFNETPEKILQAVTVVSNRFDR